MISLIVPVFNEEDAIPVFHASLRAVPALSAERIEIVFVDDGSSDRTIEAVRALQQVDPDVRLLSFTRNFGKEPALFAGLEAARGDAIIPIDVDLQDPVDVIPALLAKWRAGAQIVLAKRVDRESDGVLKRKTAEWFYRVHNRISKVRIEENVGDFRLMSRDAVSQVLRLGERNLFMKGVLAWVGGRTEIVEYTRAPRSAGEGKFNGWKLWNLAIEGFTSFSTLPLRMWTYAGVVIALLSFLYAIFMVVQKLVWGNTVPGYPSLMVAILFMGGVQLISVGVLGEYIGRIYLETKGRPRYVLKDDMQGTDRK
ncbi:glycosyltransferase [Lysobacteraceae bacterium NML93-0792]|nr:glycosyltransferase [Xanthomonadaceae bacterium NML93-0792]PBS15285.1 glycosyltransferase [Xanthomonadaceae bacterium NML93-0793]PBS18143.1 glycosyltransferase [Xanthomonadaceae bacterium NML93-0831]